MIYKEVVQMFSYRCYHKFGAQKQLRSTSLRKPETDTNSSPSQTPKSTLDSTEKGSRSLT